MKKYFSNKFVVLSLVLIVVCVLAGGAGLLGNSPEKTLKKLENAVNSGNSKKVAACYDSGFSAGYEIGKAWGDDADATDYAGFKDVKVKFLVDSREEITPTETELTVMAIYTDRKAGGKRVMTGEIYFHKINGKWLIEW